MEMGKSRARSITSDRGQDKEAGGSRGERGTRRKNLHEGESEGKTEGRESKEENTSSALVDGGNGSGRRR